MANDRSFEPMDWETDQVLWRNAQWAVTTYGIENVSGPYHYYIDGPRICEFWRDHMAEKNWVVADLFNECLEQARRFHNG